MLGKLATAAAHAAAALSPPKEIAQMSNDPDFVPYSCEYCGKSPQDMTDFPVVDKYITSHIAVWCNDAERVLSMNLIKAELEALEAKKKELMDMQEQFRERLGKMNSRKITIGKVLRTAEKDTVDLRDHPRPNEDLKALRSEIVKRKQREAGATV